MAGTRRTDTAGAAVRSTIRLLRPRCSSQGPQKGWGGLGKGQRGVAMQEKPQRHKEDMATGTPYPQCHTGPALGTIPVGSCWRKNSFPVPRGIGAFLTLVSCSGWHPKAVRQSSRISPVCLSPAPHL